MDNYPFLEDLVCGIPRPHSQKAATSTGENREIARYFFGMGIAQRKSEGITVSAL